jgi:hypothetical protein
VQAPGAISFQNPFPGGGEGGYREPVVPGRGPRGGPQHRDILFVPQVAEIPLPLLELLDPPPLHCRLRDDSQGFHQLPQLWRPLRGGGRRPLAGRHGGGDGGILGSAVGPGEQGAEEQGFCSYEIFVLPAIQAANLGVGDHSSSPATARCACRI